MGDQNKKSSSVSANHSFSSLPSTSERSSTPQLKQGMESDEEIRRVPETGGEACGPGRETGSVSGPVRDQGVAVSVVGGGDGGQRKRGRNPADKETKRLKRLLRNRVSAQQARERKKAYLSDLENRMKDLEKKNSELEEKMSTLQNENQMLRQILKNTTAGRREASSSIHADGSL